MFYQCTHKQYWKCWALAEVCTPQVLLLLLVFSEAKIITQLTEVLCMKTNGYNCKIVYMYIVIFKSGTHYQSF